VRNRGVWRRSAQIWASAAERVVERP